MPPIFKALASITVWILFINGCAGLLHWLIQHIAGQGACTFVLGMGVACLILSVCTMKLRQMLE